MGEINYELLDTVHKFIHRNPDLHYQGSFADGTIEGTGTQIVDQNICGTTACFAGWTAILAGYYQTRDRVDWVVNPANGEIEFMSAVAQRELGLTDHETADLFLYSQDISDVDEMVERLHRK